MASRKTISEYIETLYSPRRQVKIFHYRVEQTGLYEQLEKAGFENYLGIIEETSDIPAASAFYCVEDPEIVRHNNGDVLILEKARERDVRNALNSSAGLVVFKPDKASGYFSFLALLVYKLWRRKKWTFQFERFWHNGKKEFFVILERKYKAEKLARHYLSPKVDMEDFFCSLNEKGLTYVVLRWFDEIPFQNLKEDVDLLVADSDLSSVHELIDEKVGIIPFDIYSVSGLQGSDYEGMAYYPPYLAEEILGETDMWNRIYAVPNKKNHFLSLLYHAVYHKGEKSGFAGRVGELPVIEEKDHNYPKVLSEMAAKNEVKLEQWDLPSLHHFLEQCGWAPATDTLRKLSLRNHWLKILDREHEAQFEKTGELMVFVIREWAVENNQTEKMLDWFEKVGLTIVTSVQLDDDQKKKAAQNLRGGNWGQGPWPMSGGPPAIFVVVYDYHPAPLEEKKKSKYPNVSNAHYLLKEQLRSEINEVFPKTERANPIHSSDDEVEALDYISAVVPELLPHIRRTIEEWDRSYETAEPVLKDISENRRRAKVELINFRGQKAVKKTYKAGKERFLEREKFVYGELSKECSFIPPLLDSGDNYIVIPFFETKNWTRHEKLKKLILKLRFKKDIFKISEFFYRKGYALIDFHPGNLLMTKEGLKVIDFEFLYQYEQLPNSFKESFDLLGFPDDFQEDKPYGIEGKQRAKMWRKILY